MPDFVLERQVGMSKIGGQEAAQAVAEGAPAASCVWEADSEPGALRMWEHRAMGLCGRSWKHRSHGHLLMTEDKCRREDEHIGTHGNTDGLRGTWTIN